jgi:hypothetical protein
LPPSPELISLTRAEEGETTVAVAGRKVTASDFDLPPSVTNTDLIDFFLPPFWIIMEFLPFLFLLLVRIDVPCHKTLT